MGELKLSVPFAKNQKISSHYGWRTLSSAGRRKFHFGIDYAVKEKTSVTASESGVVIRASEHTPGDPRGGSLGKLLIIDHTPQSQGGRHIYTLYAHLSGYSKNRGEEVEKGEKIGLSGSTGTSTGPHLHFAVIDAGSKLSWGTNGPTGVRPTTGLFKDPKDYIGQPIQVEGTLNGLTDEDRSKIQDKLSYKHIIDLSCGTYRIDVSMDGNLIGHFDKDNSTIRTKVRIPS